MKPNHISLRVSEELDAKLQRQAERSNLTKSSLIVNLLEGANINVIDKSADLIRGLCNLSIAVNNLSVQYDEIDFESVERECNFLWQLLK